MAAAITKNFNIGDTVYHVVETELNSGVIERITVDIVGATTTIYYHLTGRLDPVTETLAFATAEEAAEDLKDRVLEEFE